MDDRVSIIINYYNAERFLANAIASVFAQTHPHWEIICWDNASTDGSRSIAGSFPTERLRYFRSDEHTSLGRARQLAFAHATGEYLLVLDSDDLLCPKALESLLRAFTTDEIAITYGGADIIDVRGNVLSSWKPAPYSGAIFEQNLRAYEIPIFCMIRRQCLLDRGLTFDPRLESLEDYCLYLQLAAAYKAVIIDDVVAQYRVHDNALTNRSFESRIQEREYSLNLLADRYPELRKEYRRAFRVAYAQCDYYRAHQAVIERRRFRGIAALGKHAWRDYRFALLFCLMLFPFGLWNYFHRIKKCRLSVWKVLVGAQRLPAVEARDS